MSRFFNRIQKSQDWSDRDSFIKKLDVQEMLETVNQVDAVVDDMQTQRFGKCRRIELPRSSKSPVLFPHSSLTNLEMEPYRTLRTRLVRLQGKDGFRSIVVSSSLPRDGKSLTTMNLALCVSQLRDYRVLVVDGDLRTSGLTHLLGNPDGPGLAEILSGQAKYEEAIQATNKLNLYVLGAGTAESSPSELFAGGQWKEFIGWCAESFKLILVDSPPVIPLPDFEQILSGCDSTLLVVRVGHTRRELLTKVANQVDQKKILGLIFNSARQDESDYYANYSSKYGKFTQEVKANVEEGQRL